MRPPVPWSVSVLAPASRTSCGHADQVDLNQPAQRRELPARLRPLVVSGASNEDVQAAEAGGQVGDDCRGGLGCAEVEMCEVGGGPEVAEFGGSSFRLSLVAKPRQAQVAAIGR